MNNTRSRSRLRSLQSKALLVMAVVGLAAAPEAYARFGGGGFRGGGFGGFRGGGGGFRGFGGDGFGGGRFGGGSQRRGLFGGGGFGQRSASGGGDSWRPPGDSGESHPDVSSGYQTYHSNQQEEQQERYNEANKLQKNRYNEANYLQANSDYNPYGDCCYNDGSDTGVALGAAALGAVGGMAVGSALANNSENTQSAPAYNYNYNYAPPPIGTTVYSLPPGATITTINGSTYYVSGSTYYKPFYSGSQVIYIVSRPS